MKWFILLLSLLFIPTISHAAIFNYSGHSGNVKINIDVSGQTAKIILQAKQGAVIPPSPLTSPTNQALMLSGIKVWDNLSRSGNPVYQNVNLSYPRTVRFNEKDEYTVTGLSPTKKYYLEYYIYNSNPSIRASAYNELYLFADTHIMTVEGVDTTIRAKVTGPVDLSTELVFVVRTDKAGGAVGSVINNTGAGFVKMTAPKKVLGVIGYTESISNLQENKTYYVDLAKKNNQDGKYYVVYKATVTTKSTEKTYSSDLVTERKGKYLVLKGFIDKIKYNSEHQSAPANFVTDFIATPLVGTLDDESGFTGEPILIKDSQVSAEEDVATGIDAFTGNYAYQIPLDILTSGKKYYFKETITTKNGTKHESKIYPITTEGIVTAAEDQKLFEQRSYRLLAPLPGLTIVMDPSLCEEKIRAGEITENAICNINDLINLSLKILIGVCAALLVFRLMRDGYNIVVTDIPALKASAKGSFKEGAIGLLLALTAYIILNTINPKLVSNEISVNTVKAGVEIVNLPDAGDSILDPDFKKKTGTYSKDATISPEMVAVVNKIKNEGWEISAFRVYTNNRMLIQLKKAGQPLDNSHIISVGTGVNGFSQSGQGVSKDKKTPIGNWKIIDIRKPKQPGQPVYNAEGSNMGAAFFHLNPTIDGDRGIGVHGNKSGTLTGTNGCIRMKNADIEAILPYIKVGIPFTIG